jgi:hypothetical protein
MELPKDIANWVNRLLLGVVAFFLYQINQKIINFEDKIDTAIINQALVTQEQERIKSDISKLDSEVREVKTEVIGIYKLVKK